jgi:hypothetical protein
MLLRPTAKAHRELHPGVQTLTLRQRSVLLLAERRQRVPELERLFNGMGQQIVCDLLAQGYLTPEGEAETARRDVIRTSGITALEPTQEDL